MGVEGTAAVSERSLRNVLSHFKYKVLNNLGLNFNLKGLSYEIDFENVDEN
jgi:hypothetical protein